MSSPRKCRKILTHPLKLLVRALQHEQSSEDELCLNASRDGIVAAGTLSELQREREGGREGGHCRAKGDTSRSLSPHSVAVVQRVVKGPQ